MDLSRVIQNEMTASIKPTIWLLLSTWLCFRRKWIRESFLRVISSSCVEISRNSPSAPMSLKNEGNMRINCLARL